MRIRTVDLDLLDPAAREALSRRSSAPDPDVRLEAASIVDEVRRRGDEALWEFTERFGGGLPDRRLRIPAPELEEALETLDDDLRRSLERAAANIRAVHEPQRPDDGVVEPVPGVRVERRWSPLRRVGVYVPGGRATYPSSLLMGVIPAQVAGVDEIVVATPSDDRLRVDATVMAAAALLEIDEVYAVGGAQAVAALAYGTGEIRRVDKIVGPGGPWVTAAKLAVAGECAIDLPAGPSEAAIVVDATADPEVAAADLLCQAEHGAESQVVLVTIGADEIADSVLDAAERRINGLAREDIIRTALVDEGLVVRCERRDDALAFTDAWAPEHLTLHVSDVESAIAAIPSAGSVFVGHWSPESAGDYATGANHVLPTGGLARSHGPLAVDDFGSWRQVQTLTEDGLRALAPTIRRLAHAEGLTAHAAAVDARLGGAR